MTASPSVPVEACDRPRDQSGSRRSGQAHSPGISSDSASAPHPSSSLHHFTVATLRPSAPGAPKSVVHLPSPALPSSDIPETLAQPTDLRPAGRGYACHPCLMRWSRSSVASGRRGTPTAARTARSAGPPADRRCRSGEIYEHSPIAATGRDWGGHGYRVCYLPSAFRPRIPASTANRSSWRASSHLVSGREERSDRACEGSRVRLPLP
jgi:hypothetical protein